MSRFEQKYYKRLLEERRPEDRRNVQCLYKEKTLWNLEGLRKYFAYDMVNVHTAIILFGISVLLLIVWSGLADKNNFHLIIGCIVAFVPMVLIAAWYLGNAIWIKARSKKVISTKEEIELKNFVSQSSLLQKYNTYHVKAIRQTLGHIYSVSPEKIYLSDTPASLRTLGCAIEPYSFELILGVGKRLGIIISEAEVDRIAERIYNNAHNVEELTAILCEEISLAEEAQSNADFETQFIDAGEELSEEEEKGKLKLGLPGFAALICFLGAINVELAEGDKFFTLSTLIFVLKVTAIGYIVGLTIRFVGLSFLKYLESKKPEDSQKSDGIDLEELTRLTSPVNRYICRLIIGLYHKQDYEKILRKYEPLPLVDGFDPEEMPWFSEVANHLKKMAKIEQVPFIKPRNKTIGLVIGGEPIKLNIEFLDGLKDGHIKLVLEK